MSANFKNQIFDVKGLWRTTGIAGWARFYAGVTDLVLADPETGRMEERMKPIAPYIACSVRNGMKRPRFLHLPTGTRIVTQVGKGKSDCVYEAIWDNELQTLNVGSGEVFTSLSSWVMWSRSVYWSGTKKTIYNGWLVCYAVLDGKKYPLHLFRASPKTH